MRERFLVLLLLAACDPTTPATPDAGVSLLPVDHATWTVVRSCRTSVEHDLNRIVVKTSAALAGTYRDGPTPFPVGTVILKEQFDDPTCRTLNGYTLMRKEMPGYDPDFGDWRWQRLDRDGRVLEDGKLRKCSSCHRQAGCRDFACAEP